MDKRQEAAIAVGAIVGATAVLIAVAVKVAKPPPSSIRIGVTPSELPSGGGTVHVSGITIGIADGSTVRIYTSLSQVAAASAVVVNNSFGATIVLPANMSAHAETVTIDAV